MNCSSANNPFYWHGGNIEAARARFANAPEPWLDLSTGINPVAYPIPRLDETAWARLPSPADIAGLERAAGVRYGATTEGRIVAAPGTQVIIQALSLLMKAGRVGVLGPTYGEHEKAWRSAGAQVSTVRTLDALRDCDVAVVVNPNNPDGQRISPARLLALAADLRLRGGTLIVDEAFADVLDEPVSVIPTLPPAGLIALRSFGKAYGLAGLRLGFAVVGQSYEVLVRRAFGPWSVSGPAIQIGCAALADGAWIAAAKQRLVTDAKALDRLLGKLDFRLLGGTPLFRLVATPDAVSVFDDLANAGILVRTFPFAPDWIRFGVPYLEADRQRLRAALTQRERPRKRLRSSASDAAELSTRSSSDTQR